MHAYILPFVKYHKVVDIKEIFIRIVQIKFDRDDKNRTGEKFI